MTVSERPIAANGLRTEMSDHVLRDSLTVIDPRSTSLGTVTVTNLESDETRGEALLEGLHETAVDVVAAR